MTLFMVIRTPLLSTAGCLLAATTHSQAAVPAGYELSWAEEFNGSQLDESAWWYRADEKQQSIQLPSNVEVDNGELVLNLTPLATPINGFDSAGAGIISQRRFHYGYYETGVQTITIDEDFTQLAGAQLLLDLADAATHDQLEVSGGALLAGELVLSLSEGGDLPVGTELVLLTAEGGILDAYDTLLAPEPGEGRAFELRYTSKELLVEVVPAGDYNRDGAVDAADYSVWRDMQGQDVTAGDRLDPSGDGVVGAEEYALWQANYGTTLPSTTHAVPEPTLAWMLGVSLLAPLMGTRRH